MKKYLILMSMAAAGVAFAATGSRDKTTPTPISDWTGDNLAGQIIWRGENKGSADLSTMTDLYVKADGDYTLGFFTTSGSGGNHTNMHLDLDGNTLTSTTSLFTFNDDDASNPPSRSYAAGYYIENNASNVATLNINTNATFNLATYDYLAPTDVQQKYGRVISIGTGVEMNTKNLNVNGKFMKYDGNTADPIADSAFIVNGTLNTVAFNTSGTNVNVTGTLNSTGVITINNTHFTNSGAIDAKRSSSSNGDLIIKEGSTFENTGTIKADNMLEVNGATFTSTGTLNVGSLSIKNGANVTIDGTFKNYAGDAGSIVRVRGTGNSLTGLNQTGELDFNHIAVKNDAGAADLTVKGTVLSKQLTVESNTSMTVDSGAVMVVGDGTKNSPSVIANSGSVVVKGMLVHQVFGSNDLYTTWVSLGNVTVDGGTLAEIAMNGNVGSAGFGIKKGQTIKLVNGGKIGSFAGDDQTQAVLALAGGTLELDATSRILTKQIAFAMTDSTSNNGGTLKLGSAANLAADTRIIIKDNNSGTSRLELAKDSYEIAKIRLLRNSNLTIDLSNDAQITIGSIESFGGQEVNFELVLEDFQAGLVKVNGWTTELISSGTFSLSNSTTDAPKTITLKALDALGNVISGLWSVDKNGYLYNSGLVPEPAEWAAIFGAIALGLALYRRRK